MARIPRISKSNPLSQFQSVAPAGGIMFSVLAEGFDEIYDRVEPVAIEEMQKRGAAMGKEEARRQIGDSRPVAATATSPAGGAQSFNDSLAVTESGGNYRAANDEGYVGKYQFGNARLADYKRATGESFTKEQFRQNSALQEKVQGWHIADIDSQVGHLAGQVVQGTPLTLNALRAMAHLGGVGGAKKFVATNGKYNPSDSNGTSLLDYARTHGGAGSGGRYQVQPVTTLQKSDGTFEARQYSPFSGPILRAHDQAAKASYASEVLDKASIDLLSISQGYILDPSGYAEAAEGYIDQIIENVPEDLQPALRSEMEQAVHRRQMGILDEKHKDIRQRAANSNGALVDRYSQELTDALASGDEDLAAEAQSRLDGVLRVRESLPGLAWTDTQSANVFGSVQRSAQAARERAAKAATADHKATLETIIKAGKAGLVAEGEGILADPAVAAQLPELVAEAKAFTTMRDQMPEFLSMTPDQQQGVVDQLRGQEISEDWQIDVVTAMEKTTSENRKAWREDPIQRASETLRSNPPPPLPDLTVEDPQAFTQALAARREYGNELVDTGYTDTRAFFTAEEGESLKALFGKDVPPELRAAAAGAVVAGFGADAVGAFNEIGADPVTMFAGKMMAVGGSPALASEIMRGQVMLDEGHVTVPPNSDRIEAFNTDTAEALSGIPGALSAQTELMAAAQAIYAARAKGVEPDSEAAKELMSQSIQAALGQSTNKRNELTGGVQDILGRPTLLPVGVSGEQAQQALNMALTGLPHGGGFKGGMANLGASLSGDTLDEEERAAIWDKIGGGPMLNGFPLHASFVRGGEVRMVSSGGSQYRLEIQSGSVRLDAEDADGNVFFFDLNDLMEVVE